MITRSTATFNTVDVQISPTLPRSMYNSLAEGEDQPMEVMLLTDEMMDHSLVTYFFIFVKCYFNQFSKDHNLNKST